MSGSDDMFKVAMARQTIDGACHGDVKRVLDNRLTICVDLFIQTQFSFCFQSEPPHKDPNRGQVNFQFGTDTKHASISKGVCDV